MEGTGEVLEVVGYNVAHQQYLVTGTVKGLAVLGKVLDPKWREGREGEEEGVGVRETVEAVLERALREVEQDAVELPRLRAAYEQAREQERYQPGSPKMAKRKNKFFHMGVPANPFLDNVGFIVPPEIIEATLGREGLARDGLKRRPWFKPLEGAYLPFHSSVFRRGTTAFQEILDRCMDESTCEKSNYLRTIPNIMGKPMSCDDEFVSDLCECLRMANVGEQWNAGRAGYPPTTLPSPSKKVSDLIRTTLLAQFSSAVQWSDTIDFLLDPKAANVQSIIEVSPSPVLAPLVMKQIKEKGWRDIPVRQVSFTV